MNFLIFVKELANLEISPTNLLFGRQICSTLFLGSIMVNIPACHAGVRGSIPRRGEISRCNGVMIFF